MVPDEDFLRELRAQSLASVPLSLPDYVQGSRFPMEGIDGVAEVANRPPLAELSSSTSLIFFVLVSPGLADSLLTTL